MEPMIIWTAVIAVVGVLTLAGSVIGWVRKGDKESIDNRFNNAETMMTNITTQMVAKASKDELDKTVARFEKDISDLRLDQKTGFAEIKQDIKDLHSDIKDLLRAQNK
jgi:gas vesicle protein